MEHGKRAQGPAIVAMIANPRPARSCNSLLYAQKGLSRGGAETHEDLGRGQLDLPLDERQARLSFLKRRRPVARRAPWDDIGDIDLPPVEADGFQHAVEQLPGPADNGPPDAILVAPRRLPDEHHPRPRRAVREHELGRGSFEAAP